LEVFSVVIFSMVMVVPSVCSGACLGVCRGPHDVAIHLKAAGVLEEESHARGLSGVLFRRMEPEEHDVLAAGSELKLASCGHDESIWPGGHAQDAVLVDCLVRFRRGGERSLDPQEAIVLVAVVDDGQIHGAAIRQKVNVHVSNLDLGALGLSWRRGIGSPLWPTAGTEDQEGEACRR